MLASLYKRAHQSREVRVSELAMVLRTAGAAPGSPNVPPELADTAPSVGAEQQQSPPWL